MTQYKQNPRPTQAWRITLRVDNAPGPFASMRALAQYDVTNRECLPPPDSNPGGHTSPVPTEDVEIPLTKVGENEYTGTVYADRMLDEDYHGRGVCRWKLVQARVHMKASGAEEETQFIPSIPGDKVVAGEPETIYLAKRFYPKDEEVENMPVFGRTDRSNMNPSVRDEDLFTVKFTPHKEVP